MKLQITETTTPTGTQTGNYYQSEDIEVMVFPSGERMPRLSARQRVGVMVASDVGIIADIRSGNDLFDIAQVVDAIRESNPTVDIHLNTEYIMCARQDRVCNEGEPLSARVVARMINSLGFVNVVTTTPHSDVLPALINNCNHFDLTPVMLDMVTDGLLARPNPPKHVFLVSPDAGATKRTFMNVKYMNDMGCVGCSFVQGEKHRDPKTGELSGFGVGNVTFTEDDIIIVTDDVCARGGTFIGLAKALYTAGASSKNMYLTVVHADSIEGLRKVSPFYGGGVFTTTKFDVDEHGINIINNDY